MKTGMLSRLISTAASITVHMSLSATLAAQTPVSAHWKSTISDVGRGTVTAVSDTKPDGKAKMRARAEVDTPQGHVITIVTSDAIYSWVQGQKQGMKISVEEAKRLARNTAGAGSSVLDYSGPASLEGARITGSDKIGDEMCDKYERNVNGQTQIVWVSKTRQFPIKATIGTLTVTNSEIEVPSKLADEAFEPPKDIQFTDLSEMLKRSQPQPEGKK